MLGSSKKKTTSDGGVTLVQFLSVQVIAMGIFYIVQAGFQQKKATSYGDVTLVQFLSVQVIAMCIFSIVQVEMRRFQGHSKYHHN